MLNDNLHGLCEAIHVATTKCQQLLSPKTEVAHVKGLLHSRLLSLLTQQYRIFI